MCQNWKKKEDNSIGQVSCLISILATLFRGIEWDHLYPLKSLKKEVNWTES